MIECIALGTGRISTFGGPQDLGVSLHEGLALIEPADLADFWFGQLFFSYGRSAAPGLARRLNPSGYYLAARWDYSATPRDMLRQSLCVVTARGRSCWARPVDWGPHERTGRRFDLSPGLAAALRLKTDDAASVALVRGSAS